jgi:hypothetical protein
MKQDFFFQPGDAAFDPLWQFDPGLNYRPRVYKSDFSASPVMSLLRCFFPQPKK